MPSLSSRPHGRMVQMKVMCASTPICSASIPTVVSNENSPTNSKPPLLADRSIDEEDSSDFRSVQDSIEFSSHERQQTQNNSVVSSVSSCPVTLIGKASDQEGTAFCIPEWGVALDAGCMLGVEQDTDLNHFFITQVSLNRVGCLVQGLKRGVGVDVVTNVGRKANVSGSTGKTTNGNSGISEDAVKKIYVPIESVDVLKNYLSAATALESLEFGGGLGSGGSGGSGGLKKTSSKRGISPRGHDDGIHVPDQIVVEKRCPVFYPYEIIGVNESEKIMINGNDLNGNDSASGKLVVEVMNCADPSEESPCVAYIFSTVKNSSSSVIKNGLSSIPPFNGKSANTDTTNNPKAVSEVEDDQEQSIPSVAFLGSSHGFFGGWERIMREQVKEEQKRKEQKKLQQLKQLQKGQLQKGGGSGRRILTAPQRLVLPPGSGKADGDIDEMISGHARDVERHSKTLPGAWPQDMPGEGRVDEDEDDDGELDRFASHASWMSHELFDDGYSYGVLGKLENKPGFIFKGLNAFQKENESSPSTSTTDDSGRWANSGAAGVGSGGLGRFMSSSPHSKNKSPRDEIRHQLVKKLLECVTVIVRVPCSGSLGHHGRSGGGNHGGRSGLNRTGSVGCSKLAVKEAKEKLYQNLTPLMKAFKKTTFVLVDGSLNSGSGGFGGESWQFSGLENVMVWGQEEEEEML